MVAAGVGVTLLPELAVRPPVPHSDDIDLVRFDAPVPSRDIAMFWRRTSAYAEFLPELAATIREVASPLLEPPALRAV
jgi:LysR family hydrogen peroxide-inducible transcriptional activator